MLEFAAIRLQIHKPQRGGQGRQVTVSKNSMRAGLLIGCSIFVVTPVFAKTATTYDQTEADTETKEAIVVVGSRIEGTKIVETLQVTVRIE